MCFPSSIPQRVDIWYESSTISPEQVHIIRDTINTHDFKDATYDGIDYVSKHAFALSDINVMKYKRFWEYKQLGEKDCV